MTPSQVFSINLTYLRISTNPNRYVSIKKSQAILKCFVDLKSSVWFTLGSENETMFCDTWNFFQLPLFPLSAFLFPLSSFVFPDFSRKDRSDSVSRVDCRSFSVKKPIYLIEPHTISESVLCVDPVHIITGFIYHNILLEGSKGVRVNSFVFTFA